MLKVRAIYMALLLMLVDCFMACTSSRIFSEPPSSLALPQQDDDPELLVKPKFKQQIETEIPIENSFGQGLLKADIFRPLKQSQPKTLVIVVPGSGHVSRRGEVASNGVENYPEALEMSFQWAKSLSEQGFFVLSYDKRTCHHRVNSLCNNNEQRDVDQEGIMALARDLDQICRFAQKKLEDDSRIILFSTTQGAQTIALSQCQQQVNGIVLLSPIIGNLDTMWVDGLKQAAAQSRSTNRKNRLLNQKESMASFFASLKRGDFPENSNIHGASVKFWQSWLEASTNTLGYLKANNKPIFMLFSNNDSFSSNGLIKYIKNNANKAPITIKIFDQVDRNFISTNGVPQPALESVTDFIKGLPKAIANSELDS